MSSTDIRRVNPWVALAGFVAVTIAVAALGSLATSRGMDWYDTLDKPGFTPPDATFGIVWTILYAVVAYAGWRAWRAAPTSAPTVAWGVQMALNLAWTVVFFGLEAPTPALIVIAALILAVAVDVVLSWRVDRVAGGLLVPYLLWCGFASALNIGVVALN